MNRVIHFEIHASDTAKLAAFYNSIFGWEVRKWDHPDFDYWIVMTGPDNEPGGINGGITGRRGLPPEEGQAINAAVCTISVASIDRYTQRIVEKGGKIATPKSAIAGVGWLVYFKDPDGNLFGMLQDDKEAK